MARILYAFVNNIIEAEKEYEFYLYFDSFTKREESKILRCHLYDSQFFLEYYLPEIPLSSMQKVNSINSLLVSKTTALTIGKNIRSFKIKFPAQLAGGTFKLDFYLQGRGENTLNSPDKVQDLHSVSDFIAKISNPSLSKPTGMYVYNNQISVDVTIESSSGPSFEKLYWGKNEEIEYGKKSPSRSKTTVYSNEMLYAHLHTEGLYGKPITIFIGNNQLNTNIKDNTLVVSYNSKIFFNSRLNQIFFRIRDVSLPYGTLVCKHSFKITPDLKFDSSKALKIKPATTSATNVTNDPKTDDWKKMSKSTCRVDFRPSKNYDGSFGFSWFRVEDTEQKLFNDNSFLKYLGFHYESPKLVQQDPNSTEGKFQKNDKMINNHINDYQRILIPSMLDGVDMDSPESVKSGKYLVPQMTIQKGEKAELEMYIKNKTMPQKFSFEFSNPLADKFLTIDKKELDSIKKGDTIKIECKKEFSKAINLNVYAYPQKDDEKNRDLCGSIRILPNDVMHQRNVDVLIINVCLPSDLDNTKSKKIMGSKIAKIKINELKKFYGQSYFKLHVKKKTIKLHNPNDPLVDSYYQDKKILPLDIFKNLRIADSSIYSNDLDYYKGGILAQLMDNLTNYISDVNRYCYKIIQIPWTITEKTKDKNGRIYYDSISGFSFDEIRLTFCFEGCNDSTPTHELGHAFGLPHTFTGCTSKAKYVYQYAKTDNFMDYSHQKGVDRHSFYYWQWKAMNVLME